MKFPDVLPTGWIFVRMGDTETEAVYKCPTCDRRVSSKATLMKPCTHPDPASPEYKL